MYERNIGYLELFFSTVLLGATIVYAKFFVANFSVFVLLTLRFGLGSLIFIGIKLCRQDRIITNSNHFLKKDWLFLCGQATCSALFNIFLFYGLQHTSATEGGILSSTVPIFTALLSWIILKEHISRLKFIAIIVTVAGITILNLHGHIKVNTFVNFAGNGLIILAVISGAMLSIFIKLLPPYVKPFDMAFMSSVIPFFISLPFGVIEAQKFNFGSITMFTWILILSYAVIANILFPVLWNMGQVKVPASTASLFTGIVPISTMVLSVIFLDESVNIFQLMGLFFILMAILLVIRERT